MLDRECESNNKKRDEIENDLNFRKLNEPKLCRFCHSQNIASKQIIPNGLRGCKCPDPSPHYKPLDQIENFQPVIKNVKTLRRRETICKDDKANIAEDLASRNDESCPRENDNDNDKDKDKEFLKNRRSFIPPQGMEDGQYPKALFHQYYKNPQKISSFDVLPLPFLDRMNYQGMITLSMNNKEIKKNWQKFINGLPNSELPPLIYPDEKLWRWKTYLRYKPDEMKNDYRYKMKVGPKLDGLERLPITGEDLQLYRESRVVRKKKFEKRSPQ